jgi:translation initiation factor 3 subunit C
MLHPACVSNDKGSTDFKVSHPAAASGKPVLDDGVSRAETVNWTDLMNKLCTYVYKHGTEHAKTRSTICHVYHHALHDRFLEARDLLLMSHLQENIYSVGDITTMILFNRMMVTLGMCAFRLGLIWEAHQCLGEVCSGRVRELLAQGVSMGRFSDKTPEQEKAEKRRQVPYHQHINLDLLEACHLISAMLLEVPVMAAASVGGGDDGGGRRTRPISRTFRKYHDIYDHQVFTGPPEQTRDFVMRAANNMMKGDWKNCVDLVTNLEVWALLPGEDTSNIIKTMLAEKIKLEGLRTYLFAFSSQYDSLSLSQLCAMFEMSKNEVHSVVSKMMINRELYASWDQPTETIVLRKVEPNTLQVMALQFAEKAATLVDANERLLDAQSGSHGYKDEYWKSGDNDKRGGGNYGGRGGGRGGRGRGGRDGGGRYGGRGGGRGRDGGRGGRGRGGSRGGGRGGGRGGRGRGGYNDNRGGYNDNRY